MNKFSAGSQILGLTILAFFGFADLVSAQIYGVPPVVAMYGIAPGMGLSLSLILTFIGSTFFVFVAAPFVGLFWYLKKGGQKRWPRILVWTLVGIFIVMAIATALFIMFSGRTLS